MRDQVGADMSIESSGPYGLLPASREAPMLEVSPQPGTQRSLCRPQGPLRASEEKAVKQSSSHLMNWRSKIVMISQKSVLFSVIIASFNVKHFSQGLH